MHGSPHPWQPDNRHVSPEAVVDCYSQVYCHASYGILQFIAGISALPKVRGSTVDYSKREWPLVRRVYRLVAKGTDPQTCQGIPQDLVMPDLDSSRQALRIPYKTYWSKKGILPAKLTLYTCYRSAANMVASRISNYNQKKVLDSHNVVLKILLANIAQLCWRHRADAPEQRFWMIRTSAACCPAARCT